MERLNARRTRGAWSVERGAWTPDAWSVDAGRMTLNGLNAGRMTLNGLNAGRMSHESGVRTHDTCTMS